MYFFPLPRFLFIYVVGPHIYVYNSFSYVCACLGKSSNPSPHTFFYLFVVFFLLRFLFFFSLESLSQVYTYASEYHVFLFACLFSSFLVSSLVHFAVKQHLYSPEIHLFIISLHRLFLLLLLCFSCCSCEHIFIFVVFYILLFFSNSLLSLFSA